MTISRTRLLQRVFRARGHFYGFLTADSRRREFPGRISAVRIRVRKLEATTTRRRRGSPVCKKELSSNRINDPLASIYRIRGRRRERRTRRRDVQGRTRGTVFQRGRSGSCFSTSSFCRALPLCEENIICFLAVLGSLCRRRKFNRARALFLRTRL